jgi:hypothetical protein
VREDWTLYRSTATLCQRAGVPATRLTRLVLKELVDSALDAAGAAPVSCTPQGDGYVIEDRGPGIPASPADIGALFSIGRLLVSSKLWRRTSRGALGGALAVWTRDQEIHLVPHDDGTTQWEAEPADFPVGTRILIRFGPAMPADPEPLNWALRALAFRIPQTTDHGRSSAHWYDADTYFELLQAAGIAGLSRTYRRRGDAAPGDGPRRRSG